MTDLPVPGPEKITYKGTMFEIVQRVVKVGDHEYIYENARRAPGVRLIIPTKDGKILLTKEYRAYMQGYDVRLPGGKVFDSLEEFSAFRESGADMKEAAKAAAIKEAREEVGLRVKEVELFGISKSGASVEWDLYYFVVTDYAEGTAAPEAGEDITPQVMERNEAKRVCLDGSMHEERSALMLLRYLSR